MDREARITLYLALVGVTVGAIYTLFPLVFHYPISTLRRMLFAASAITLLLIAAFLYEHFAHPHKNLKRVGRSIVIFAPTIAAVVLIGSALLIAPEPSLGAGRDVTFVDYRVSGEIREKTDLIIQGVGAGTFVLDRDHNVSSISMKADDTRVPFSISGTEYLANGTKRNIAGSGVVDLRSGVTYKLIGPIQGSGNPYLKPMSARSGTP